MVGALITCIILGTVIITIISATYSKKLRDADEALSKAINDMITKNDKVIVLNRKISHLESELSDANKKVESLQFRAENTFSPTQTLVDRIVMTTMGNVSYIEGAFDISHINELTHNEALTEELRIEAKMLEAVKNSVLTSSSYKIRPYGRNAIRLYCRIPVLTTSDSEIDVEDEMPVMHAIMNGKIGRDNLYE